MHESADSCGLACMTSVTQAARSAAEAEEPAHRLSRRAAPFDAYQRTNTLVVEQP
jgi:hypothetical protein